MTPFLWIACGTHFDLVTVSMSNKYEIEHLPINVLVATHVSISPSLKKHHIFWSLLKAEQPCPTCSPFAVHDIPSKLCSRRKTTKPKNDANHSPTKPVGFPSKTVLVTGLPLVSTVQCELSAVVGSPFGHIFPYAPCMEYLLNLINIGPNKIIRSCRICR